MHILGCLDTPTSGQYFLDGKDVSKLSDDELADIRSNKIGFVFQAFNLLPRTTVMRNVTLPLVYSGTPEAELEPRAAAALRSAGLPEDRWLHKSNQLSGGQIQRVAIARSLVNNPSVIMADEPTGNLDSKTGEIVLGTFQRLNNEHKVTIVLITHDPDTANCAERIIFIKDGLILEDKKNPNQKNLSKKLLNMTIRNLYRETASALLSNKSRSGLTVLGIVIGIASVIIMLAVGNGTSSSIQSSIQGLGSNLLTVSAGAAKTPGSQVSGSGGSAQSLTLDDATAIQTHVSGVANVSPEVMSNQQIVAPSKNINVSIYGVNGIRDRTQCGYEEGSFISDKNLQGYARVVVLGPTARDDFFGTGAEAIGQTVRIDNLEFTVVGITKTKGGSGFNNPDNTAYIPLTTAQQMITGNQYLSQISVEADSSGDSQSVQDGITALLLKRHRISDSTNADFNIQSQASLSSTLSSITTTLTYLLAAIASISLLVGGIGIMNMMLTTVTERTKEIGLRKAIGAKKRDISIQFLTEAVALTMTGGIIGVIIGYGASYVITLTGLLSATVSLYSVLLAVGVSMFIGIVFGYFPARRAAALNPIEALRYE